jgi:hypothetical protein
MTLQYLQGIHLIYILLDQPLGLAQLYALYTSTRHTRIVWYDTVQSSSLFINVSFFVQHYETLINNELY